MRAIRSYAILVGVTLAYAALLFAAEMIGADDGPAKVAIELLGGIGGCGALLVIFHALTGEW